MPAFTVSKSIEIDVPAARVREAISDFNTWPTWSPWLIMEPGCEMHYKGTPGELGHGYDWQGEKIGSGGMVMTLLTANRMESDLLFLKPWKSHADVAFDFQSVGENKTVVEWSMDSQLPFFMFFMVDKMKSMIGADYNRGLIMLKDYLERGSVPSSSTLEDIVEVPASLYVGKTHQSSMTDKKTSMGEAFPEVYKAASDAGAQIDGQPFSIYNKMDITKQVCTYTAAIPVAAAIDAGAGTKCAERSACKALKVTHIGPYRHLGNAWAMGMGEIRHKKLKMDKNNPPFELYINDPEHTPEESLITEICIPLRS